MLSPFCAVLLIVAALDPGEFFRIHVVDEQTGRGVPLVELRTVNDVLYVTDSAGMAAVSEPGLKEREVFFSVKSHGYEFPKDGFGFRGRRLKIEPGGKAELRIKRLNIAERLYRITGGGIYRDSVLLGDKPPLAEPLLNGQVFGSDSVVAGVYGGKIHWFWGDTNRPSYPLGLYQVPGATSRLPADAGLDPSVGVDLTYFVGADGFARETCPVPGPGPTWIDSLMIVPDAGGRERMFAPYMKIKAPLTVYERGLVAWDDDQNRFVPRTKFPLEAAVHPGGHSFRHTSDGIEHVYFVKPFPLLRVAAKADALADLGHYETWTYFPAGDEKAGKPERGTDGKLVLGWKKGARPLDLKLEQKLVRSGDLKATERYFVLADKSGKPVVPHSGSVNWNAWRKKWVMLFSEFYGTSLLGEVWYAEADAVTGPWTRATKVATHEKYDFYNPRHHAFFDQDGGRVIYFEGTYTNTFSGNPERTPRYNYNQIMYRLDLADERLR